jgi:hypothetical protein
MLLTYFNFSSTNLSKNWNHFYHSFNLTVPKKRISHIFLRKSRRNKERKLLLKILLVHKKKRRRDGVSPREAIFKLLFKQQSHFHFMMMIIRKINKENLR